jgi:hypothetical protein
MAKRSIGNMREVVVFLQNTPVPAAGGGFTDSYTTLCTTRGQLLDTSGSRSLSFGAGIDNVNQTLIVRFQTALFNALRSDTKIVINGLTYTFSDSKLIDQKKHLYEFRITAQSN